MADHGQEIEILGRFAPLGGQAAAVRVVSQGISGAVVWCCTVGSERFALRRWPPSLGAERLEWIHLQLQQGSGNGAHFVPVPITATAGRSWLRSPSQELWELTPWLPGDALTPQEEESQQTVATEGLACFHRAMNTSHRRGPSPALIERSSRLRLFLQEDTPRSLLRQQLYDAAQRIEPSVSDWAKQKWPLHTVQVDSRPEHFLIADGEVTGLVDFGAMAIDTPAIDIARLAGELALGNTAVRNRVVNGYNRAAVLPVDPQLVATLDLSGALVGVLNWLGWLEMGAVCPQMAERRLQTLALRLGIPCESLVGVIPKPK